MKQLKYKCLLMLMSALFSVGAWGTSIENVQDADLLLFEYDEENHTAMVTGISESAMELENLVLTIPATVTYETVTYTVNAIGDYAFMEATNLASVNIPASVTSIGDFAFMDAANLVSVNIPASVTTIGESAFVGCVVINSITVDEGNTVYDSRDNCNAIIETATNTLLYGSLATVIPETVTAIYDEAFAAMVFDKFVIPASVTTIGSYAFFGGTINDLYCYAESVPELGEYSFTFVPDTEKILTTLHVPESAMEAYQTAAVWQNFTKIVAIVEKPELAKIEVEYFVNSDPGLGLGESFEVEQGQTSRLDVESSLMQFGLNRIGIRLRSTYDNGAVFYSPTVLRYAYRYHAPDAETSQLEYFIGTDPGIGKAVKVEVNADAEGNFDFMIPADKLSYGLNVLGIRLVSTHSEAGTEEYTYSPTVYNYVYRYHAEDAHTTGVEYFLNSDPGIGKAAFIPSESDEINLTIAQEDMKVGINVLGIRPVSENSETGIVYGATRYQYVYRSASFEKRDIERVEYFWDSDPGLGKGTALDFVVRGDSAIVESPVDYRGLYGTHILNVRAMSKGVWSSLFQQAVILPAGILSGSITLDPNIAEDLDEGIFNTLSALLSALSTRGFSMGLNVNVADATYNLQISEQAVAIVQTLCQYFLSTNFYISMKAQHSATFNFVVPEEFIMAHASEIQQIVAAVQSMFSHILTENISILINGQTYKYDGFQVEPNDLLALKTMYNRLGGDNWTEKKWSFQSNGRNKEELPGVEFDEAGRVVSINLENNNLVGKLTADYNLTLPMLTTLNLSRNSISGDLSPFVAELGNLQSLDVSFNLLTDISAPLPELLKGMDQHGLRGQFCEYNPDADLSFEMGYAREELRGRSSMLVYISRHQQLGLPSLFTYNTKTGDYSERPSFDTPIFHYSSSDYVSYQSDTDDYGFVPGALYSDYTYCQDTIIQIIGYRGALNAKLRYVDGDANMSGATDVLDVQHTLNKILATASPFNYSAANTYADERINVQDIVCTVNIVLDQESLAVDEPNAASMSRTQSSAPRTWVYTAGEQLRLVSATEVGALAIELRGVKTSQVSLLLNHSQYQLVGRDTEQGSRYVIFSPTGRLIPAGEVTALLKISAEAEVVAAEAADSNAEKLDIVVGGEPTDISQLLDGMLAASFRGNQLVVKTTREISGMRLRLMSAGGAVVYSTSLSRMACGETSLAVNLVPGVYLLEMTTADGARKIVKLMKR